MVHVNAELLAGHALGQADELDAQQLQHVASCPQCRAEVDQLRRVVELSQNAPDVARTPPIPEERMWRNIAAELSISHAGQISSEGVSDVAGRPEAIDSQDAAPPRRGPARKDAAPPRRGPARSRFTLMLAAAVGLIAGVGGTVLVNVLNEPEIQVVAGTTLNPLPGQAGEGTAQLVREQGTTELRVSVTGSAPAEEYREVWLINTDGKRMYSLGVLPGAGTGTYAVPAGLGEELDGFTIVDVSLEPYDGNAAHSLRSQVRGTLPV